MIIGSHVGFKKDKQMLGSVEEALSYNSNTFMFYTGAPQNTSRIPINDELTLEAKELMKKNNINIDNVIIHAPYIINLANSSNLEFNVNFLKQELSRVKKLGIKKLVLHPGSHVGLGKEQGIKNIINALDLALDVDSPIICLETMSGKGTELMSEFEDIKYILDNSKYKENLMVCLDTCHVNDAG